jgi:putative sterol carrier protein
MADVHAFFTTYLPKKLSEKPELITSINNVFQFNLGDAGNWIVDLTPATGGSVAQGTAASAGCVVTCAGEDFGKLLSSPASAMTMFMSGRLKVSNMSLGMQLQKILS